jgi:hypothetical protein
MNNQEKRTLDSFKRARDFDAAHPELFPAGALGRELFDELKGVVDGLEAHAAAESTGRGAARQGTTGKAVARDGIIEGLDIFRRTARSLAYRMPGIEERFPVPYKQDGQELLTTARSALGAAVELKTEFLRREVPERVYTEMEANINAYAAALTDQHAGREESITAAARIDALIQKGLDTVRQLDPIVRNKLHDNTALLAAWLTAKRIERPNRRNGKKTNSGDSGPQTPDK